MPFADTLLAATQPPARLTDFTLPRRERYHPSPTDWRDEILYFLLPDRFSDGNEASRPLLDRTNLNPARPDLPDGTPWRWDNWARSGSDRFQGGRIRGITSKLDYLHGLGITTLWVGPVFTQRAHENSYHGYGIQNFLDVDPRFGTRSDLVEMVSQAHSRGIRVILDIIFNHSGSNWIYPAGSPGGRHTPAYTTGRYDFGSWLDRGGTPIPPGAPVSSPGDSVAPAEFRDPENYTRAGSGSLGAGDISDPDAEHKRSDFITLRDFRLDAGNVLGNLARCYKYWVALTDCDGFRIDTLKHVSLEQARNFCGSIKEFAANIGKQNFFLVGEIAGGDFGADRYLDVLDRNLDAALDIGEMRLNLNGVAKGLMPPAVYFDGFEAGRAVLGSHRNLGNRHVSILDDHDHVFGQKIRFSAEAASDHQVVAGVALQFFTLGIPCVYYGTEQSLGGPEPSERQFLPDWKGSDRYLRETMFGALHPRGDAGSPPVASEDQRLPGFGPFGTAGSHCFDLGAAAYRRIAAMADLRGRFPVLRGGRQYARPISFLGKPLALHGPGEIVAWSRILDDEEALCVLNVHGNEPRGADIVVDASLNPPGSSMTVVLNTAEPGGVATPHAVGSTVRVQRRADGLAFVEIRNLPPSELLVLTNHP